jgi:DNA repair protein RecN (Recombination protein N)
VKAMLLRLHIENLALIERADLEPAAGLNVLTGETGAGKTMLAEAIGLLAGAQTTAGLIGPHADEAYVEAEFELPDGFFEGPGLEAVAGLHPAGEDTLVVARRLLPSGRSRAMVWGRTCARADLEALGERLLEVSSQHEARRLATASRQLELLDAYAHTEAPLEDMAEAWRERRSAQAALEAARAQAADAARHRLDLEDLVARADAAAVEPGEPDALRAESTRLRHLDELMAAAADAAELLSPADGEGAQALAARAGEAVSLAAAYEPRMATVAGELRDAAARLQESAVELRGFVDELEADPGRLEHVEARLEAFSGLERRYAAPLDQVLAMAADARTALERLDGSEAELERLSAAAEAAAERARACAADLTAARTQAAPTFARAVEAELADLGMADARFGVRIEPADLGARGADRVVLELAANPGLPAGPVADTASGGELSRIALAIRVAARAQAGPGVLLLDEVDAGIGGRTARAVAGKLQQVAADAQVLVITHLPQIAGVADAHFRVEKLAGDPTATAIVRLEGAELVDELARMLGGEEGDEAARRHAEALRG